MQKSTSKGIFGNSMSAREARLAWLLVAPTALIIFGLVLFPAFFSVWISFHDVSLDNLNDVFSAPFVGFDNYDDVRTDFAFRYRNLEQMGVFFTTIVYSFASTALTMVMGLLAALILNQKFVGRSIARGIFLFPYVAPVVSVAFVWKWILDPRPSGVLNDVLMSVGAIDLPKAYLAERPLALILVIVF